MLCCVVLPRAEATWINDVRTKKKKANANECPLQIVCKSFANRLRRARTRMGVPANLCCSSSSSSSSSSKRCVRAETFFDDCAIIRWRSWWTHLCCYAKWDIVWMEKSMVVSCHSFFRWKKTPRKRWHEKQSSHSLTLFIITITEGSCQLSFSQEAKEWDEKENRKAQQKLHLWTCTFWSFNSIICGL